MLLWRFQSLDLGKLDWKGQWARFSFAFSYTGTKTAADGESSSHGRKRDTKSIWPKSRLLRCSWLLLFLKSSNSCIIQKIKVSLLNRFQISEIHQLCPNLSTRGWIYINSTWKQLVFCRKLYHLLFSIADDFSIIFLKKPAEWRLLVMSAAGCTADRVCALESGSRCPSIGSRRAVTNRLR